MARTGRENRLICSVRENLATIGSFVGLKIRITNNLVSWLRLRYRAFSSPKSRIAPWICASASIKKFALETIRSPSCSPLVI
jgi:hypothetical protein